MNSPLGKTLAGQALSNGELSDILAPCLMLQNLSILESGGRTVVTSDSCELWPWDSCESCDVTLYSRKRHMWLQTFVTLGHLWPCDSCVPRHFWSCDPYYHTHMKTFVTLDSCEPRHLWPSDISPVYDKVRWESPVVFPLVCGFFTTQMDTRTVVRSTYVYFTY